MSRLPNRLKGSRFRSLCSDSPLQSVHPKQYPQYIERAAEFALAGLRRTSFRELTIVNFLG
jgi:hypothetical protein